MIAIAREGADGAQRGQPGRKCVGERTCAAKMRTGRHGDGTGSSAAAIGQRAKWSLLPNAGFGPSNIISVYPMGEK
ncbi:hypothetical protein [Alicyclobacillus acidiphilus]|uniref:hypothetical protein n=1 Tax=Alicyclobacillus acidiphilus TaxID=182455 RepID=UPI0008299D24|nr:hypothetical protein [Alicyclobacillus acidiphilus]